MSDKPLGNVVNLPGHAGEGREHPAALISMPHPLSHPLPQAKSTAARQPRFAITSVKLWEAFVHRWRLALTVGLVLAGLGVGLACLTYEPKYTATAYMRMQSAVKSLIPRGPGLDAEHREE